VVHTCLKDRAARPITWPMSATPSFRFRLERIRALRQRKENLARLELARAISERAGSEDRLRRVEAHLERAHSDQRHAVAGDAASATAAELLARQAFVEHVEAQRTMGMRDLERHDADVAVRGAQLGHASREREILERLKERRRSEYEREVGRREGALLDEIALEGHRRSAA
jgi:flagellar protein FliJ